MQIGLSSILSLFAMLFRCGCLPDLCFTFANPLAFEVHGRKVSRRDVLLTPSNAITNTPVLDKGLCKDRNWTLYKEHCYRVYNTFEYFPAANNICKDNGGTLALIKDEHENSVIEELVRTKTRYKEAWIGLSLNTNSKQYEWVDKKTTITFTNWVFGRPSTEGLCAEMIPGGRWSNTYCYSKLQFVCKRAEVKLVPEDKLTKTILMIALPISCVIVMMIFVAYLCFRSHEEIKATTMDDKKISQHFVDIVANSATVATEETDISKAYNEAIKKGARKKKGDENRNEQMKKGNEKEEEKYRERRKRTISTPNGKDKMYKQVTFV